MPCACARRESARDDADSYHDLMRSRFGKWGGRAVAVAQVSLPPPPPPPWSSNACYFRFLSDVSIVVMAS